MNWDELIGGIGQHTVEGLSKGAIFALVALGYTLVYGVLKLINFAHSEVFMIGTVAVIGAWHFMGVTETPSIGMAIVFLLVGAVVAAGASGGVAVLVERVAYRRLRRMNAPPLIFLITAIGVSLTLMEFMALWGAAWMTGKSTDIPLRMNIQDFPRMLEDTTIFTIGGVVFKTHTLLLIGAALLMMFILDVFINKTRYGRGVRAVAQNADTAALMGVNQDRVIMLIFLLGGIMAGVAALLWNVRYGYTKFDVGFVLGLKAFTAAVLGGIGNLRGALLGGLLLGVVEVYASVLFQSRWEDVAAFVVLVVVLMFRPTGLLGESLGRARA
ncbi:branched-chain amino acid ABC transporter permease [Pilimelia columellifera subsp. columellifera]|uniref:Branched-chain amino acid ABC transporter permease n=1 Tax=Pilimelia columellifera subsp. columellifera TaxID=706583 RepID=A0ABN3N8Y1_9ACTN